MEQITYGELWKEKTFIIATHSTKLLDYAEKVIYLKNGEITFFGEKERFKDTHDYIEVKMRENERDAELNSKMDMKNSQVAKLILYLILKN